MTSQHTLNLQSVLLILLPDQSFLREFPAPANHFYLTSLTKNWDGSGLPSPKALMSSQVLLTSRISLRLVRSRLLLVQLNSNFIDAVSRRRLEDGLQILHTKGRTGKILLMKPMRKARHADSPHRSSLSCWVVFGNGILRGGHWSRRTRNSAQTGIRYSMTQFLKSARQQSSHTCAKENSWRSAAFPLVIYVYAQGSQCLCGSCARTKYNAVGRSAVSTGNSVVEFVQHVRTLRRSVRIVVIAGTFWSLSLSGRSTHTADAWTSLRSESYCAPRR